MRRGLLAVVAALVLWIVPGCGDEQVKADNAYVSATNRAVRSFETQVQQVQSSFSSVSTPRQDLQTLGQLRVAVHRAVAQLRRIQAPTRIAPLHARLIDQVQEYDTAIAAAEPGIKTGDLTAVRSARPRFSALLVSIATKITATITRINERLQ